MNFDKFITNVLNSYTFVYILMPMIAAYICTLFNVINIKDHHIPKTLREKKQKDFICNVANFVSIWVVIMLVMAVYKNYLKFIWGIN